MAPIPNPAVIYAKIPVEYPVPGESLVYKADEDKIDLDNVDLGSDGVLIKIQYISVDPYLRGKMVDPSVKSYAPPAERGIPFASGGVGVVLRSASDKFKKGDHVAGAFSWQLYKVYKTAVLTPLPTLGVSNSVYLGAAGMPAQTAFYSLKAFGDLKEGETLFCSTAAGAVGAIVCQLAKIKGLKVIGATGDDEKVEFLKEIGVDVAFNYKTTSTWDILKEHGPIDVYFDNVGGEILDAALANFNTYGRIIMCGYASEYNKGDKPSYGLKYGQRILTSQLSVNGFIVATLRERFGLKPFTEEYLPYIRDGKIKYKEDKTNGLENACAALVSILKGENKGKGIVVVSEDD